MTVDRYLHFGPHPERALRVALYSHDTMGVGHMRRNQLIGQALAQSEPGAQVLLLAGAGEASMFARCSGMDCLSLPSLFKDLCGNYSPGRLDIGLTDLIALRSRTISAAVQAFRPDVFIVDKVPRGVANELDETLEALRLQGGTRCVLGLREVLDDAETVQREWEASRFEETIARHYDQIWVYGDADVFDPLAEYSFPAIAAEKTEVVGFLDQRERLRYDRFETETSDATSLWRPDSERVLCVVGGGQDGLELAATFCQASVPRSASAVVLAGPCMSPADRRRLASLAAERPDVRYVDSHPEADLLMQAADRIVSMAGYNTVCSVLSFGKSALLVPRVSPRTEQLIRARRLAERGLVCVLHPRDLCPKALSDWLGSPPILRPDPRSVVDLNGLKRIPRLLQRLVHPVVHHPVGKVVEHVH